jgi:hypothetical protein
MRLKLERGDARSRRKSDGYGVFDEVTGKCVGTVSVERVRRHDHKSYPTRTIQLFDSKYIGSFNTHTECVAFVKGIESMLNYLLKAKDAKSPKAVLDDMLQAKGCESEE